jgi:hypothetical protein
MEDKFLNKLLIALLGLIIALIIVKLLFFKRKTKDEIKLEQEKRMLELQNENEKLKQKIDKEKTKTEEKKIETEKKLIELKEKKDLLEFDRSNKNPLNDNYKYSKLYSPTKIYADKNSYSTAKEIDRILNKFNVNEEKVINLFNEFKTKDEIAHWKKHFQRTKNSDWTKLIANSFKGVTDPYEDLRRLYSVIINKP